MCRLSWNLRAWTSWNPQGLSRPVMGLLYIYYSTCFGEVRCPSSGVSQPCTHAIGVCHAFYLSNVLQFNYNIHLSTLAILPTFKISTWQIHIAVYTVLRYSWWWTVDLSETCRNFIKYIWEIVHLVGFHYKDKSSALKGCLPTTGLYPETKQSSTLSWKSNFF